MVDLSAITGPVGRLVATAQNGLEVLRYGGLETGAVPSPFQIIQSVPMYRLRRYFPPDALPEMESRHRMRIEDALRADPRARFRG